MTEGHATMPGPIAFIDALVSFDDLLARLDAEQDDGEPATLAELARDLKMTETVLRRLADLADYLRRTIAETMEEDRVQTPYGWLAREELKSVSKDNQGAREALRNAIIRRWSVDPLTGEVRTPIKDLIDAALREYDSAATFGGLKAGARVFGVEPSDFVTETPRGAIAKLVDA